MVRYKLFTNSGERENNEDYVGMKEKNGEYCFVLADGLGGHGYGEVASETVVNSILCYFEKNGLDGMHMNEALDLAQNEVISMQKTRPEYGDMKTTVVVLHISEAGIRWAHIGDSRLYYFTKNKIRIRTLDHSVPQMLVLSGEIKEKEIRHHSDRNRLLRVIGVPWESPRYEISDRIKIVIGKKQKFLLCTDGFWELIDEKTMCKQMKKSSNCEEWLEKMVSIVAERGIGTNMDNYSAIVVTVED